jgi:hypothetical protein
LEENIASIFVVERYAKEESTMKAGGTQNIRLAEVAGCLAGRRDLEDSELVLLI